MNENYNLVINFCMIVSDSLSGKHSVELIINCKGIEEEVWVKGETKSGDEEG